MTNRSQIIERGTQALLRLMEVAEGDSGQCRHVAAFLLSLYNSDRFPMQMDRFRAIDTRLFRDCMAVLELDACVCEMEIHRRVQDGSARFERLAAEWGFEDLQEMRQSIRRGVKSVVERVDARLGEGVVNGEVLICSGSEGYRDISMTLQLTPDNGGQPVMTRVALGPTSSEALARTLVHTHLNAWRKGHPIDKRAGEEPASWIITLLEAEK